MAAQQGFQYEINAANCLRKYGLVPKDFTPAGAGHNQPDLMLEYHRKKAGCELKITAASAGSLALKYNSKNAPNPWYFTAIEPDEKEKLFIKDLAASIHLFDEIKKHWKNVPYKRETDSTWAATAGRRNSRQRYERDLKMFPDIKGILPASRIEDYYNRKATYYVNVGTHGFYLMGSKNPFQLRGVPSFGNSAGAIWRARVQYKGNDQYQFVFELQFRMKMKSPYNIAPVDGKTVNIIQRDLNLSIFDV